jgi:UDPglucose 6-dehydrogenase
MDAEEGVSVLNISVVGLGKLGSPMCACFAAKGHRVVGVDLNERFVQLINEQKPPVFEPGLAEMLAGCGDRLSATTDLAAAVLQTDVTFIIVPTPSEPTGGFSLKYALAACETIGKALKTKDRYHVVVVTSTVMPGATGGPIRACLESASGKRCPADFGLCYSPEFIALGSVIRDFLNPDLLLIGESDLRAGNMLTEVYRGVHENQPAVARMTFANAELTKLAVNTFVTTKISYANMIAQICERIEGGNVDEVTAALGRDSRIGPKYLKGGLGYGGPCFPRDNAAIAALARELGVLSALPEATDRVNQTQVPRLRELVLAALPPGGCVGILGVSYKPDTNVTERAQGLELAQALLEDGVPVLVYDRCAADSCRTLLKGAVRFVDSPTACAREADVVVVATPSPEFRSIGADDLMRTEGQATVIDCWRLLDRIRLSAVCRYVALGTHDVQQLEGVAKDKVLKLERARAAA